MSEVMKAIQLSHMENDLQQVARDIKKHEGIINSVKITNQKFKDNSRKQIEVLIKKKHRLTTSITEAMLLDIEVK